MGVGAIPVVLTILLVFFAWRLVFSFNKDLVRVKAWGDLARRSLPFVAITAMAASLPLVQGWQGGWMPILWVLAFATVLVVSNFLSVPLGERRASRAFRNGDYAEAAALYRRLVEERPLARYWAFLGAALGADERREEAVDASTKAIELDPKYGLAYYNRASALAALGEHSRARDDLQTVFRVDSNRRLRRAAEEALESLEKD